MLETVRLIPCFMWLNNVNWIDTIKTKSYCQGFLLRLVVSWPRISPLRQNLVRYPSRYFSLLRGPPFLMKYLSNRFHHVCLSPRPWLQTSCWRQFKNNYVPRLKSFHWTENPGAGFSSTWLVMCLSASCTRQTLLHIWAPLSLFLHVKIFVGSVKPGPVIHR